MKLYAGMILTLALLTATGGLHAARQGADRLDGTWAMESVTVDGDAVPAEKLKDIRVHLKGETFAIHKGDKEGGKGTFKADATKTPKAIDVTPEGGPNPGKALHGIYKLEGDKLTVCIAGSGKDRPTEFASKPGSLQELVVYKREK